MKKLDLVTIINEIRTRVEKENPRRGATSIGGEIASEFKYRVFLPALKEMGHNEKFDFSMLGLMVFILRTLEKLHKV